MRHTQQRIANREESTNIQSHFKSKEDLIKKEQTERQGWNLKHSRQGWRQSNNMRYKYGGEEPPRIWRKEKSPTHLDTLEFGIIYKWKKDISNSFHISIPWSRIKSSMHMSTEQIQNSPNMERSSGYQSELLVNHAL